MTHARIRRPLLLLRPWVLVLPVLAALLAGCSAGVAPPIHSEQERLELGRRALVQGDVSVAIELLRGYITNNAGGADVDLAVELLGEANLRIKEWAEAQGQFERVLRDYPESDSAAAASYLLGEALWGQARGPDFDQEFTQKALEQWQGYLRSYPGHWRNAGAEKRVREARERLATKLLDDGDLYLKLGRTAPARVYYHRLLDEYPDAAVAARATAGIGRADALDQKRSVETARRAARARRHGAHGDTAHP